MKVTLVRLEGPHKVGHLAAEAPEDEEVLNEEERKRLLSESAKLRARARRQYKTQCLECSVELVGLARRRFCGQACQRRNWRRRLAAMGPGDPLPPPEEGVR
jgi:hypothetical protein